MSKKKKIDYLVSSAEYQNNILYRLAGGQPNTKDDSTNPLPPPPPPPTGGNG